MKRRKRMPIPQHEFGFASDAFNLIQETGIDGEKVARALFEIERAREESAAKQQTFSVRSSNDCLHAPKGSKQET